MFLVQSFGKRPLGFSEILEVEKEENFVVSSHCGRCALSMAASRSEAVTAPVRLFERGACVRCPAKGRPVTFANRVGWGEPIESM